MLSLTDLVLLVKQFLAAYMTWIANPDLTSHRLCPCGCHFRHRHGQYCRDVVLTPVWIEKIPVLRLKCPVCGRTESILPGFLRRHSPYPWIVQQAVILAYLTGSQGYRPVADEIGLSWPLLWQWVDLWAARSRQLYTLLAQDLLTFAPELWEDARPEEQVYASKTRTVTKQQGLAWLAPVLRLGLKLWRACAQYFPFVIPSGHHVLAFLDSYLQRAAPSHPT
jgi:hypothetical protein